MPLEQQIRESIDEYCQRSLAGAFYSARYVAKIMKVRKLLILLTPLLLAGCINESASYYIAGNQHALTVRAQQDYFWSKQVTLKLIASRLPECQHQLTLGEVPAAGLEIELLASGANVYTLRTDGKVWQVETQGCTQLKTPAQAQGEPLGTFRLDERKKMVFEQAKTMPMQ